MAHNEATSSLVHEKITEQENSSESPIHALSFELDYTRPDFCYATITVPPSIVQLLYHEAARSQQQSTQTAGFHHGNVPIDYIKRNFTENLIEHLKELLLKYCVVNFLYEQIRTNKLVVSGDPRLMQINFNPEGNATFSFELSLFPDITIYEWKYFPFKAPKRKNYKDLDRQVESFIEEERTNLQKLEHENLTIGDWVSFNISFVDHNQKPILDTFTQNFWFKLGEDETESPLRQLFINRKMGDVFYSNHQVLQEYFSDQLDTNYTFCIEITSTLSHQYFCFDHFKRIFRIKTNKDMHKKLIEVFSYRNDVSQRYAMVEEALHTLLAKHRFRVPNYLILRQQKVLLDRIKYNPDYQVYRAQKDFQNYIHDLAHKQVVEMIFIDKLAYHENIQVTDDDIKGYLNLINRPRMKEFIYFDVPSFKIQGQEVPIPTQELIRTCLREKTINYVIYHLTKK
jgi:FKBP-type peptidyl-prolyl cis-trans isomerase (trigger factor)